MSNLTELKEHIYKLKKTQSKRPEVTNKVIKEYEEKIKEIKNTSSFKPKERIRPINHKDLSLHDFLKVIRSNDYYKNISFHKNNKNWQVYKTTKGKRIVRSGFKTVDEAIHFRDNVLKI